MPTLYKLFKVAFQRFSKIDSNEREKLIWSSRLVSKMLIES